MTRLFGRAALSIAVLPGVAVVLVPTALLVLGKRRTLPTADPMGVLRCFLAVVLLGLGGTLFVTTVGLFAGVGRGTLAPWDPPKQFVARGPYRHVRNPMITGVLFSILGEASLFGSLALLGWGAVFFVANSIYIPLAEEPGLARRFGASYDDYRRNVPRWLPCVTPFRPSG